MALDFVSVLQGKSDSERKAIIEAEHRLFQIVAPHIAVLVDAYDGLGGFLDGSYLWRYPREKEDEFKERQAQARYHNYVKTLVSLYLRKIFSQGVTRSSTNEQLTAWWEDVDGSGTTMDSFMRDAAGLALAGGYVGLLADKTRDAPSGPSQADEQARVFLTRFAPTAIPDWRLERDTITAIKLLEAVPSVGIAEEPPTGDAAQRYLFWTPEGWARFDHEGQLIEELPLPLGVVPFTVLRAERFAQDAFLGQSLFGNANVIKALYNRASEEDEVLRDQAFSLLVVNLPTDANVEDAKSLLGQEIGTTRALFVKGTADFKTADMQVPATLREAQQYLVAEIYRMAHLRFDSGSREAETAEAIRLQHDELNEMLQGFAADCTRVEQSIARHWFHWMTPGETGAADAAYEAAEVDVQYPRDFFLGDLEKELREWVEATGFVGSDTFTKRLKRKAVMRVEPDLPPEELETIEGEIDAQPPELTADQKLQMRMDVQAKALGQGLPSSAVEDGEAA
jgi:hypothetical protein